MLTIRLFPAGLPQRVAELCAVLHRLQALSYSDAADDQASSALVQGRRSPSEDERSPEQKLDSTGDLDGGPQQPEHGAGACCLMQLYIP